MATVYNLEPQPTAKVILHTTSGDLSLELFAAQTPLTSRNFLQHCLDGYYNGTIFHRLVPGFIIQGGDPTNTGSGGESTFEHGAPFADEFHSRLKFNRRGLLGMANSGKDDNGSQFFLTLGKTEELTGRNTMFGRVEAGNTIFNLVKMGESELGEEEGSERPLFPTKITGAEVLVNPFEGMVAREKVVRPEEKKPEVKKVGGKKKAKKTLLSFGGEEGEEGVVPVKAAKFNPKLVNTAPAEPAPAMTSSAKRPAPPAQAERAPKRRASPTPPPVQPARPPPPTSHPARSPSPSTPSRSPSPAPPTKSAALLSQTNAQIAALKASLKRDVSTNVAANAKPKSALEAMIPITATRGRRRKGAAGGNTVSREEQRAIDEFNAFKRKLESAAAVETPKMDDDEEMGDAEKELLVEDEDDGKPLKAAAPPQAAEEDDEAALCDLHFIKDCQSCRRWDEEDDAGAKMNKDDDNDTIQLDSAGWLSHKLTFEKDRLGKDLKWKEQNEKELVVIDPREREKEIVGRRGGAGRSGRGGREVKVGGGKEWDRR